MKLFAQPDRLDPEAIDFYVSYQGKFIKFGTTHIDCLDKELSEAVCSDFGHAMLELELKEF